MSQVPQTSRSGLPDKKDGATDQTMKLITFTLGEGHYAVNIMDVREIRVWSEATALPETPPYVRGVVNLRGAIVPIFDLRDRFGQGVTQTTEKHVVIVVTVEDKMIGLLVDTVSDIVTIAAEEIRKVPDTQTEPQNNFLQGLIQLQDHMLALVDPEKLFSVQLLQDAEEMAQE